MSELLDDVEVMLTRIVQVIRSVQFSFTEEIALQDGIERELKNENIEYRREVRLGKAGRIDFLCSGVGIEVKVAGATTQVFRQVQRYLEHRDVSSVVLVTTKRLHVAIPRVLMGKPVQVVWIGFQEAF